MVMVKCSGKRVSDGVAFCFVALLLSQVRANKLHQQQMEMLRATSDLRNLKSGKNSAFYSVDENVTVDVNQARDPFAFCDFSFL